MPAAGARQWSNHQYAIGSQLRPEFILWIEYTSNIIIDTDNVTKHLDAQHTHFASTGDINTVYHIATNHSTVCIKCTNSDSISTTLHNSTLHLAALIGTDVLVCRCFCYTNYCGHSVLGGCRTHSGCDTHICHFTHTPNWKRSNMQTFTRYDGFVSTLFQQISTFAPTKLVLQQMRII